MGGQLWAGYCEEPEKYIVCSLGVMAKASKERAGASPQKANLALTW